MVKAAPFTLMDSVESISVDPGSLLGGDVPPKQPYHSHRNNGLQSTLNKAASLRNLDDTPVSCPHPSVSQQPNFHRAIFNSLSLRDMGYDPNEDNSSNNNNNNKPSKGRRDSGGGGTRGLGGKFKETVSKTVGMALKSSPTKKSQKASSAPEEATSNTSSNTATTPKGSGGGGELKVVDNGTHLELQTEESDDSNNTDTMEDNSSKQVNARAPGRLRRTGSTRNVSNRNLKASDEYSRQRSKSKNGRRAKEDAAASSSGNNRRSKSQDKAAAATERTMRKLNRSKSERKFRASAAAATATQETTQESSGRNRSKSRDRTLRRNRSNRKLTDNSNNNNNNSNSDLSAEGGGGAGDNNNNNRSKRAHSNSRSKQMHRARSNKKLENSQSSELSAASRHGGETTMSASEPGHRTRSSSRTRRDKSKGRTSKKLNSSMGDFASGERERLQSSSNNIGHSRSSRLALKRAASLMTNMQNKKASEPPPLTEHSSTSNGSQKTPSDGAGPPPTRGIRRVRSQSSVSARSEASARSLASMRSTGEGSWVVGDNNSTTNGSHSHHREATINAQPRRRISRPTVRKTMSQSTLWAAKNGATTTATNTAAGVDSTHSKDNNSMATYSSRGTMDSCTVEAVTDPREDDETLEEVDSDAPPLTRYPESPAGDISIDETVDVSPALASAAAARVSAMMKNEKDFQADAMAMLKEKINIKALIPDLEGADTGSGGSRKKQHSALEALMQGHSGTASMDEDSTIVSMNSLEKQSAIERAVQEAFEEALQAAVKQHTQSISSTAANHLMQRLRRDGAPIFD